MQLKLDHINLSVSSAQQSVQWYREIFGFEKVEEGLNSEGKPWVIIANNDSMLCMSEMKRSPRTGEGDSKQHQVFHFGFRIKDLDAWEQKLKQHQLKLYYGGVNEYPHSKSWYVKDPDGYTIEVSYTEGEQLLFP